MDEPFKISVFRETGSDLCVASEDGDKIFEKITKVLDSGRSTDLSFLHVKTLTSAFLNAAIGQLYGLPRYSWEALDKLVQYSDIAPDDRALIDLVIENAKLYFNDPPAFEKIVIDSAE